MDYSSLSLFVTPGFVGFDWPEYNLDTNQISASLGKGKWTVLADRVDAWQEWHRENKDRHESKSKITNRISGDPCTWSDNYPSLLIATSVDAPVHFKLQPTRYRHHDLKSTPMMGVPHRLKNRSGTHKFGSLAANYSELDIIFRPENATTRKFVKVRGRRRGHRLLRVWFKRRFIYRRVYGDSL